MRTMLAALILAGSMAAAAPGYAHHSFAAEFDADKPVKLVGTVTKVEWTNPHAWFYIDVMDESGKVANWGWELGSPTSLVRLGWTRNSLKIGTVVTVEGSRSRDGSNTANARSITLNSTGQKLFGASSQ
ncbi:MAG TPA: DUF6152 family protein [Vicinamibacterales bacterium]|nr:DUF6152 family protein [Vicinamibacterales bacterium]